MKHLLLFTLIGSMSVLYAAPMSYDDAREKRDEIRQRTPSKQEHHPIQRTTKQKEVQHIEKKKTTRMQEPSTRTKVYKEQTREPYHKMFPKDKQRTDTHRTIKMQKQLEHTREYHEPRREVAKPVYQKEIQRNYTNTRFRTQEEQRRINKHISQRDSIKRTFRTHEEFRRIRPHIRDRYDYRFERRDYQRRYDIIQHGLVYFVPSWYFIYQERHAPFYDRFGYFYGFFNHYGYFFEGIFYAYDHHYTYEDRLRGKGLFDDRYYEPYLEDGYNDWYDVYEDPYYRY